MDELNGKIPEFVTAYRNSGQVEISANSYKSIDIDMKKEGYSTLGIAGFSIDNPNVVPLAIYLSENTVKVGLVNRGSSAITAQIGVSVLYKK